MTLNVALAELLDRLGEVMFEALDDAVGEAMDEFVRELLQPDTWTASEE